VVGEAADGQEAIERAVELRPDAIVLDLVMPKINGMAAAERIKEALPNAAIVVFTAYESASLRKHADKNIDAVISMSEGLEKLETELKRLLSG